MAITVLICERHSQEADDIREACHPDERPAKQEIIRQALDVGLPVIRKRLAEKNAGSPASASKL